MQPIQPKSSDNVHKLIDHLFRHESGKMISVLCRLLGFKNLETAHDIVQDTLLMAMQHWSYGKVPENPSAWLYRVAKNKAIDFLRREKKLRQILPEYAYLLESEYRLSSTINSLFVENEIKDSQLRMMFACCHPSIAEESQIAIVLKTLCGLSTLEISKAFLSAEEKISKRIYRAKEKIKVEKIELELPEEHQLPDRLDAILKSLYLLFNEGYNSTHPDRLIRKDFCEEAIRLCFILTENKLTAFPRTYALLALMHFQGSRLNARIDDRGNIIVLKYQDRTKWNHSLIEKGFDLLEKAAEPFETSTYHFEAGIASIHASATSIEQTDWKSIYHLYELLYQYQPSPVIALHKAIASRYAIGKQYALNELKELKGLEKHHLYYASLGEISYDLNLIPDAKKYFEAALRHTNSRTEQQFLRDKIARCN